MSAPSDGARADARKRLAESIGRLEGRKCMNCGHDSDMHWFPNDEPPLRTTACRDCHSRGVYVSRLINGPHEGLAYAMCCWPRADIEGAFQAEYFAGKESLR